MSIFTSQNMLTSYEARGVVGQCIVMIFTMEVNKDTVRRAGEMIYGFL